MEKRTFQQFNSDLSWSTRIYLLLALLVTGGAFLFNAWTTNWAFTIAIALAVVLLVESFVLSVQHHPATWRAIGWALLLILLALLLIGGLMG